MECVLSMNGRRRSSTLRTSDRTSTNSKGLGWLLRHGKTWRYTWTCKKTWNTLVHVKKKKSYGPKTWWYTTVQHSGTVIKKKKKTIYSFYSVMTPQIQQGHIKSDSKNCSNVMKYLFQMNAVLLDFIFSKKSWKKI